jgi:hypothetical protein
LHHDNLHAHERFAGRFPDRRTDCAKPNRRLPARGLADPGGQLVKGNIRLKDVSVIGDGK